VQEGVVPSGYRVRGLVDPVAGRASAVDMLGHLVLLSIG